MSAPATMDFSQIPELDAPPDSLDLCRQAKIGGAFWEPELDDTPMFEGKKKYIYKIDVYWDLNGAGLIYFANFLPLFGSRRAGKFL